MKKITILFLLLFLMVSNFFFYEYSKEKQSEDVLYKNSYIYNIDYHDNLNEKKLLKDIEYFSSEQQVSIFQFIHTSEKNWTCIHLILNSTLILKFYPGNHLTNQNILLPQNQIITQMVTFSIQIMSKKL